MSQSKVVDKTTQSCCDIHTRHTKCHETPRGAYRIKPTFVGTAHGQRNTDSMAVQFRPVARCSVRWCVLSQSTLAISNVHRPAKLLGTTSSGYTLCSRYERSVPFLVSLPLSSNHLIFSYDYCSLPRMYQPLLKTYHVCNHTPPTRKSSNTMGCVSTGGHVSTMGVRSTRMTVKLSRGPTISLHTTMAPGRLVA